MLGRWVNATLILKEIPRTTYLETWRRNPKDKNPWLIMSSCLKVIHSVNK